MVRCLGRDDAESYFYKLKLDIYNSSNETRILRNIRIGFMKDNKNLFEDRPHNDSVRSSSSRAVYFEEVASINVPAKSVASLSLCGGFWNQDNRFERIWDVGEINLLYSDDKNRESRVEICRSGVMACLPDATVLSES